MRSGACCRTRRGAVMLRRDEVDYDNVAVAGPVVHQNPDRTYQNVFADQTHHTTLPPPPLPDADRVTLSK